MKRLAVLLSVALIAGAVATAHAESAQVKIGYVDMNQVLNEVREGKRARAQLEADGKAKRQKLEIMQKDIQKMRDDLEKQRLILSQDALREREERFQQKFFELQRTSMEFEREFAEKEANLIRPITEKLVNVIRQVGREQGYALIVPKAMALYTMDGADLTQSVIKKYDSGK